MNYSKYVCKIATLENFATDPTEKKIFFWKFRTYFENYLWDFSLKTVLFIFYTIDKAKFIFIFNENIASKSFSLLFSVFVTWRGLFFRFFRFQDSL